MKYVLVSGLVVLTEMVISEIADGLGFYDIRMLLAQMGQMMLFGILVAVSLGCTLRAVDAYRQRPIKFRLGIKRRRMHFALVK